MLPNMLQLTPVWNPKSQFLEGKTIFQTPSLGYHVIFALSRVSLRQSSMEGPRFVQTWKTPHVLFDDFRTKPLLIRDFPASHVAQAVNPFAQSTPEIKGGTQRGPSMSHSRCARGKSSRTPQCVALVADEFHSRTLANGC